MDRQLHHHDNSKRRMRAVQIEKCLVFQITKSIVRDCSRPLTSRDEGSIQQQSKGKPCVDRLYYGRTMTRTTRFSIILSCNRVEANQLHMALRLTDYRVTRTDTSMQPCSTSGNRYLINRVMTMTTIRKSWSTFPGPSP